MYTFVVITIVATMPEKFCQSFYSLRPKKYCTSSFSFRFFWNHQYFSFSRNKMLLYHIFERSTSAHFTGIITYISIIQPSLKIKKTYMFLMKGQDFYREGGGVKNRIRPDSNTGSSTEMVVNKISKLIKLCKLYCKVCKGF